MSMGHALRRFQHQQGMPLSQPVVANSQVSSYVRDLDFATVAAVLMFSDDA